MATSQAQRTPNPSCPSNSRRRLSTMSFSTLKRRRRDSPRTTTSTLSHISDPRQVPCRRDSSSSRRREPRHHRLPEGLACHTHYGCVTVSLNLAFVCVLRPMRRLGHGRSSSRILYRWRRRIGHEIQGRSLAHAIAFYYFKLLAWYQNMGILDLLTELPPV